MPAFIDLTGHKYGYLTVVKREPSIKRHTVWSCKCDCGKISSCQTSDLRGGKVKSCGCLKGEMVSGALLIDLLNKRFGKLLVISKAQNRGQKAYWKCICDCGNRKNIAASSLLGGKSNSCGCGVGEAARSRRCRPVEDLRLYRTAASIRSGRHAKKLGCDLTTSVILEMLKQPCFYCKRENVSRGLDRINSKRGYLLDNVVPACTMCNYGKSNKSLAKFLDWIEHLSKLSSPKDRILQELAAQNKQIPILSLD